MSLLIFAFLFLFIMALTIYLEKRNTIAFYSLTTLVFVGGTANHVKYFNAFDELGNPAVKWVILGIFIMCLTSNIIQLVKAIKTRRKKK